MASLLSLQYAPVALPALDLLFVLDGPAELGQTTRDVGVLGQEGLPGLLGLLELISLPCELYPGRLQLVGIRSAVLLPGLLGAVEASRCLPQLAAGFVPSPGPRSPASRSCEARW